MELLDPPPSLETAGPLGETTLPYGLEGMRRYLTGDSIATVARSSVGPSGQPLAHCPSRTPPRVRRHPAPPAPFPRQPPVSPTCRAARTASREYRPPLPP